MILFVNQANGKIVKSSGINTVPIEIPIDLSVITKEKHGSSNLYIDNKKVYINADNQETFDSFEVTNIYDEFDFDTASVVFGKATDNDEEIHYADIENNTPKLVNRYFYSRQKLTEENASSFKIEDILGILFSELLERSNYDNIFYNILNDIVPSDSKFHSFNRFRTVLMDGDMIKLALFNIKLGNIQNAKFQFHGIPKELNVIVNNIECDLNKPEVTLNGTFDDIIIEIINNSNKTLIVSNPYILFKDGE